MHQVDTRSARRYRGRYGKRARPPPSPRLGVARAFRLGPITQFSLNGQMHYVRADHPDGRRAVAAYDAIERRIAAKERARLHEEIRAGLQGETSGTVYGASSDDEGSN